MKVRVAFLVLFLTVSACKSNSPASNASVPSTEMMGEDIVQIKTASGKTHQIKVEIARTEEQQKKGLSFRNTLPADAGMIFPLSPPRSQSFWMENTLVSLDILFIRADGSIESIAAEMVPQSRKPRSSNEPVAAVLELKGGEAARRGIQPGDKIIWAGLAR